MLTKRVIVHGRVQGVWFRDWTVINARELGLAGWVQNRSDGSVEALLQGHEPSVQFMIERMKDGPPAASVDKVDVQEASAENLSDFSRR